MAFVLPDRTRETLASSPGTGNATTAGATQGAQSIASSLTADGDTTWATIDNGTAWETNTITRVSAGVYSRGTPFSSSNAGALVNFASGTMEIFPDLPAIKAKVLERLAWATAAVTPPANDGTALGTGALAFSDLFLASGGVLNFNNGNVTVTHSAGLLTANADLGISKASPTFIINATSGLGSINFQNNGTNKWFLYQNNSDSSINFLDAGFDSGVTMAQNATAWSAVSDARLWWKQDARPVSILPNIDKFQAYEAERNGEIDLFVKAQEINAFLPHVVQPGSGEENIVLDKNTDPRVWRVTYDRLGVAAMQGVKELHEYMKKLETRLAVLEKPV